MTSISIKTAVKSASFVKTSFMGLVAAAAFGFVSAPAHAQNAGNVTQVSNQDSTQVGSFNTSVQGSAQSANLSQYGSPYYSGINGASIGQGSNQNATQIGHGNVSVQGSAQNANVGQSNGSYYYPYGTGINAANVTQLGSQSTGQLGVGNSSVSGSSQNANVFQH